MTLELFATHRGPVPDLDGLPADVADECMGLYLEGRWVGTWLFKGKRMAAVCPGRKDTYDRLMDTKGWGRYSSAVLVWGWDQ